MAKYIEVRAHGTSEDYTHEENHPELYQTLPSTRDAKPDLVNHPPHYTFGKYEVIDVLEDWFSDKPLLWQVVKYVARADHKGNTLQDLEKAEFYLKREIERRKKSAA